MATRPRESRNDLNRGIIEFRKRLRIQYITRVTGRDVAVGDVHDTVQCRQERIDIMGDQKHSHAAAI